MNKTVSPSRTYVAVCRKTDGGYEFKKFHLPEKYRNDSGEAEWYYLNRIDSFSVIEGCFSFEDYQNLSDALP